MDYDFIADFLAFLAICSENKLEVREYQVIDFATSKGIRIQELATIELLLFTAKITTKCPRKVGSSFVNLCPGSLTEAGLKLVKQLSGQENKKFTIL
ncbi:MAG: hypothetical protein ABF991_01760 [Liquorilactobacillus hordei]|uniref:Uncharacterized protein n=2 Tax=Liquorilactobacillus hordei TaxID=468911 RepID=A0A0R1MFJ9_9LACO|nr:hypothetical protein [Liquorilactobacillus hordei]AUJ29165.1 hypothetical protein BSQ49_02465 [Liquorilactobacillus hordei]KRL06473.1 hypothetical protein FC92_GL000762 [Liquorilactobacillus hordei DSM 19519]MBZ2406583.1 hypothetical protein [Liquorilactobacillus hordei]QYH53108.1 hypothetical protein G6O70_05075 [Liquorilactobacillus hordei DSM 19519]